MRVRDEIKKGDWISFIPEGRQEGQGKVIEVLYDSYVVWQKIGNSWTDWPVRRKDHVRKIEPPPGK